MPLSRAALHTLAAAAAAGVGYWLLRPTPSPPPAPPPPTPAVVWSHDAQARGAFVAAPLVAGPRVYLAAVRDTGLHPAGAVHCLDRVTQQLVWTFDDGGA